MSFLLALLLLLLLPELLLPLEPQPPATAAMQTTTKLARPKRPLFNIWYSSPSRRKRPS
ncbi:MAG TPA: hypothetical protein VGN13_11085 [Solirubrobacteraceae bacterium]